LKAKENKEKVKSPNAGMDDEPVGDAFMTQPKVVGGGRLEEDVDPEDLKVELPRNIAKVKEHAEKEKKLKSCLNYLGIKDSQMLDHMDPNFKSALEKKTTDKLRALKECSPTYADS